MKTFTFFVLFLFAIVVAHSQDYQISFTGSGQSTSIDSIQVQNLTQGTMLSINGDDVLNLVGTVGINTLTAYESNIKVYPNPMIESSFIEFINSKTELVCLEIFNKMGILIAKKSTHVQQGSQRFKISGLNAGIYSVKVSAADWKYTTKLISLGKSLANTLIEHKGTDEGYSSENTVKSTKDLVQMQYNDGERILLKSFSGIYIHVITMLPTQSQTVNFEFIPCTDEDGNNYAVVTIGAQTWMDENLKTTTYRNDTPIPNVTDSNAWLNLTTGAYVWFDNDISWKDLYGALYNWYAVNDANVLCPTGWHVPTNDEWTVLTDFIGGTDSPHGNELKSCRQVNSTQGGSCNTTEHPRWEESIENGTDDYGFSGLPGGARNGYNGIFGSFLEAGIWWSSTESSSSDAWGRLLLYDGGGMDVGDAEDQSGFSVRCLRD